MQQSIPLAVPPQMAAVMRRFEQLFNAGEPARAVREVYTRGAWIVPPGAPLFQGQEAVAGFWEAAALQMGVRRVKLETQVLEVAGAWAYEIGHATLSLDDGQTVVARYVLVWKQEDGAWRWEVDIWNMGA